MKSPNKTIKYYDEHARDWGEYHHEFGPESRRIDELVRFHKLLPAGKIIEIGSGTGSDAKVFNKYGYEYLGTDASSGLLEIAKNRNPQLNFKNVSVQDLAAIFAKDEFDGFWCAATLLHLPKTEIDSSLQNIHSIVKNGGIGFISVKQGSGESEDDTGRLFSYYTQHEFSVILKRNGFKVLEKFKKPTGGTTVWLGFFVKVKK